MGAVVSFVASALSIASTAKSLFSKPKTPAAISAPDPAEEERKTQEEAQKKGRQALLSAAGRSGRQSTLLSTQEPGTNTLLGS